MQNVKISKARTFDEDSRIQIKGTVQVAGQVVKFNLETEYDGTNIIESSVALDEAMLVKLLIEAEDWLECFLDWE